MICILSRSLDPHFNIAAEELLLKNFTEDIFMLWRSTPSVIIGKHQNALAEINYSFIKENNIDVIRRLSGGGAVCHDEGNINFTVIKNQNPDKLVDYEGFTDPVIKYLRENRVNAKFEGKNDIRIDGKKISGNAEHVFKNRVLHHGTLLFNSDINRLKKSLQVQTGVYTDKAVKSIRSEVTNISEYLINPQSAEDFMQNLMSYFLYNNNINSIYEFDKIEESQIKQLITEKYGTWEWNFAYSPRYSFSKQIQIDNFEIEVEFSVEKARKPACQGIITDVKLNSNTLEKEFLIKMENRLKNSKHKEIFLQDAFQDLHHDVFDIPFFLKELF